MAQRRLRLRKPQSDGGFVLVLALLLLLLMSALSVALLYKVNTDQHVQRTDSGNNLAYYGAEAGMERMMADLSSLYAQQAAPNWCAITELATHPPSLADVGVNYSEYEITVPSPPSGCGFPLSRVQTISQGPNAGLMAQVVPLSLEVTSVRPSGEEVRMVRQVEVALVPVFQFGVFSQSDLSFFPGPAFDFTGRVHTNGNLFLASEASVTFHNFMRAAGDVVRDKMANGADVVANGYGGAINIPTSTAGCDGSKPACRALRVNPNEGSSTGGPTPANGGTGTPNSGWTSISTSTYKSIILSGSTGAKPLTMAFVQTGVNPIEIIRRPLAGESLISAVGESRLYNQAQIRVLFADDPAELSAGGAADGQNIRLANVQTNASAPDYSKGVAATVPSTMPSMPSGSGSPYMTYFAEASTAVQDPSAWTRSSTQRCLPSDWATVPSTPAPGTSAFTLLNYQALPINVIDPNAAVFTAPTVGYAPFIASGNPTSPPACFATATQATALVPLSPAPVTPPSPSTSWNLLDGYLRVEIRQGDGTFLPVTREWLELGFARGLTPPTAPGTNPVHPNAILLLQEPADRIGDGGALDTTGAAGICTGSGSSRKCGIAKPAEAQKDTHSNSAYYGDGADATSVTRNNWYPINMYEPREGELRENQRATTTCNVGGIVNIVEIDAGNLRRWLNGTIGTSGAQTEYLSQNGYILYFSDRRGMLPNSSGIKTGDYGFEDVINPASAAGTPNGVMDAAEDVNANGRLDTYGAADLGLSYGAANSGTPTRSVDCMNVARKNRVTGARHVVRLVDTSLGNVPTRPDNNAGGFTLASENPAYLLGDYNASGGFGGSHASSAVIADTVTLLSNNWKDMSSFQSPADINGRNAATTYYRVAIATGKNINFPKPTFAGAPKDFGTDGGVHNFLRYLEDWGGQTSNYVGSMVSLYYSMYGTGVYKCCGTVYSPPTRNYAFDTDFQDLSKMPPGTPRFRDVVSLGFQRVY